MKDRQVDEKQGCRQKPFSQNANEAQNIAGL
jgi:hypothetical protein